MNLLQSKFFLQEGFQQKKYFKCEYLRPSKIQAKIKIIQLNEFQINFVIFLFFHEQFIILVANFNKCNKVNKQFEFELDSQIVINFIEKGKNKFDTASSYFEPIIQTHKRDILQQNSNSYISKQMHFLSSININLIAFPHQSQKTKQSSSRTNKSSGMFPQKKQHNPFFGYNLEDGFEHDFHPTMSTESLYKAKKIYEKTMKSKNFGKSFTDFEHLGNQLDKVNGVRTFDNFHRHVQSLHQNPKYSISSVATEQNNRDLMNKPASSLLNQNLKKVNSSNSQVQSISESLKSRQSQNLLQFCNTFEEQDLDEFQQKNKKNANSSKTNLTRNKGQINPFSKVKKSLQNKSKQKVKKSNFANSNQINQLKNHQAGLKQKELFQLHKNKSNTKSRSKSKSIKKLKQLNLVKNSTKKEKAKQNESKNQKSPCEKRKQFKELKSAKKSFSKQKQKQFVRSKSRSGSKAKYDKMSSQKKNKFFIDLKKSLRSPFAKQNKSRQKSKSKSRSISKNKSSVSKSRSVSKSLSKSTVKNQNSQKVSIRNGHTIEGFGLKSTSQLYQKKGSHSKSREKYSASKIKAGTDEALRKIQSSQKLRKKQSSSNISHMKKISSNMKIKAEKGLKNIDQSKKEGNKKGNATNCLNKQSMRLVSTNFYHPNLSSSQKEKENATEQSLKRRSNNNSKIQNSRKSVKESKRHQSLKVNEFQCCQFYEKPQIVEKIIKIQALFRGFKVRKQLSEDLNHICHKVNEIKSKIDNKKSKYWLQLSADQEQCNPFRKNKKASNINSSSVIKTMFKQRSKVNEEPKSILSEENSIQNIQYSQSVSNSRIRIDQKDRMQEQSFSQKSNLENFSKSSLQQFSHLQSRVSEEMKKNEQLLKQNQRLKQHIRSISSEHVRSVEQKVQTEGNVQRNIEETQKQKTKQEKVMIIKQSDQQKKQEKVIQRGHTRIQQIKVELDKPAFEFYEVFSPRHYIVSPNNSASQQLSRVASPKSNSSLFHHQIPFSLQSPQNILREENFATVLKEESFQDVPKEQNSSQFDSKKQKKVIGVERKALFGSEEKIQLLSEIKPQNQRQEQKVSNKEVQEVQRKIQLLNKLFHEDKLISSKDYQTKMAKLEERLRQICLEQSQATLEQCHQEINNKKLPESQQMEQEKLLNEKVITQGISSDEIDGKTKKESKKKMKLSDLTGQFQIKDKDLSSSTHVHECDEIDLSQPIQHFKLQKHIVTGQTQASTGSIVIHSDEQNHLQEKQLQRSQNSNAQDLEQLPRRKIGFATELFFIKNYLFAFLQFIKSNPNIQKQILSNLLKRPYDSEHMLTCYRTQLCQIDQYYEGRIEGQFYAYPYWRNLIDYDPVIPTEVFQLFSNYFDQKSLKEKQENPDAPDQYIISEDQEILYTQKFEGRFGSVKDLQRVFLMMLMDVFNEAFEEERCFFSDLSLVSDKHGSINSHHTISKLLRTIQKIEKLEEQAPSYYLQSSQRSNDWQGSNRKIVPKSDLASEYANDLESSHKFFVIPSLQKQKEELTDTLLCSVLRKVLENWARYMCGLIIEPEEEDAMHITAEQILSKNTERLCLALNKYVDEYEKQLTVVIREHELCAKLVLSDKILEVILQELVQDIIHNQE